MEKRNVVENRRTPTQELVDPDDSIVKSAAAEFKVEPETCKSADTNEQPEVRDGHTK